MSESEFISVVIPCRNEADFIGQALDSILESNYPKERFEVLVVDGMSEDETPAVIEEYSRRHPNIRRLDNPAKETAPALNLGILNAKGKIIIRLDAHARVDKTYISRCVESLRQSGADNVGGNMRTLPRTDGLLARAIAHSISHPFGVGNSYFRTQSKEPKWVDTVFGGCYRREVFDRIGLFNEKLTNSQDIEFNLRLKKAGGRTLLLPSIVSYYYARSEFIPFCKHNLRNGAWAIIPILFSSVMPLSWRHLVPLAFVLGLCGSAVLTLAGSSLGVPLLILIAAAYALLALAASAHIAVRERNAALLAVMPLIFVILHLTYGAGSAYGSVYVLVHRIARPGENKMTRARTDYATVTETPGNRQTAEQRAMLYTRYHTASQFSAGNDVLEVACGAGQGLGYLQRKARRVVGGDYAENLLVRAQSHYRGRVPLVRLDAHHLPFRSLSFDTVILFEAIYYLAEPERFLAECRRVLRPNGVLLVCLPNKEWSGFNPSPFSTRYFSASELHKLLVSKNFRTDLFGAFPAEPKSLAGNIVSLVRYVAARLHLFPNTMKGKEFLKRLFYGRLLEMPPELEEEMAESHPLVPLNPGSPASVTYKVLYAIAHAQ